MSAVPPDPAVDPPDDATRMSRRDAPRRDDLPDTTARGRRHDPDARTAPARRQDADAPTAASRRSHATTVRTRPGRTVDPAITAERPLVRTADIPDGVFAAQSPRTPQASVVRRGAPPPRHEQPPVDGRGAALARRRRRRLVLGGLIAGTGAAILLAGGALAVLVIA
ncbi:hypothetical protein RZO50_06275 [Microbacterium sp. SSW1-59]|uniref:hypothetical protein n=1 Tax=Microbacterium xanthum TaxID=3079794 RepID=UPI002AD22702|nr:hypothetical protein [Microbacterium sp. SSW1-59]MDZ8201111.1 hypothetical protein [Microbacterium sp. SSW1-59]